MPIVKYIPIHNAPMSFIEYIENCEKTENGKLLSGLNIVTDKKQAYELFKSCFEAKSGVRFYDKNLKQGEDNSKEKIRLHHYIQSFDPSEKISPEEAHRIGLEWAKKVFGEKMQVIVSTHVDKGHIHNHFAVAAYDLDGKHWHANIKTLKRARRISDKIALEHGLSIIENPQHSNTMKYNEWLARQSGTSVKKQLQEIIDKHILDDDVKCIDDLAQKLRKEGYTVRLGKYMTVKPKNSKRAYRTDGFDKKYGGYSIRELEYRIENKEQEISNEKIASLSGI